MWLEFVTPNLSCSAGKKANNLPSTFSHPGNDANKLLKLTHLCRFCSMQSEGLYHPSHLSEA